MAHNRKLKMLLTTTLFLLIIILAMSSEVYYGAEHKKDMEQFWPSISKIRMGSNEYADIMFHFEDSTKSSMRSLSPRTILYPQKARAIAKGEIPRLSLALTKQDAFGLLGRLLNRTSDSALPYSDASSISPQHRGYIAELINLGLESNATTAFNPEQILSTAELDALFTSYIAVLRRTGAKVSTVAGSGIQGFADGDASEAQFTLPQSVCLDIYGDILVFDTHNAAIRSITSGKVSTLWGKTASRDIYGYALSGYRDGTILTAQLGRPRSGVYNSKGILFITDSSNNAIRRIEGRSIQTLAGGGSAGFVNGQANTARFNHPSAIACDANENIYIADTLNNCIRKIDRLGQVSTVAGSPGKEGYKDGDALTALFREPQGLAVTPDGVIYVADTGNHLIRKITDGKVITLAGDSSLPLNDLGYPQGGFADGSGSKARFNLPKGLAWVDGHLFIADSGNHRIRQLTPLNEVLSVVGRGTVGDKDDAALLAELNSPSGVSYAMGTLYISDTLNNKIKAVHLRDDWRETN